MDFTGAGKLVFDIILAAIAGIATVFGWVTKRFKDERDIANTRFVELEKRMTELESNRDEQRQMTEDIRRELVDVKATLRALPERKEVAQIHAELKELGGDLKGVMAAVEATQREVSRTSEYLMSQDRKS